MGSDSRNSTATGRLESAYHAIAATPNAIASRWSRVQDLVQIKGGPTSDVTAVHDIAQIWKNGRVAQRLLAMAADIWHNWTTDLTSKRSLIAFAR